MTAGGSFDAPDASTSSASPSDASRPPAVGRGKRDREGPARRMRVVQALVTQAGIVAILLVLAFFQRADRQALVLYLATLIVPMGWAYAFWSAHQREETGRREGRWERGLAAREQKRTLGILGALVVVWVALAIVVLWAF